jgi:hypothetical protein
MDQTINQPKETKDMTPDNPDRWTIFFLTGEDVCNER